ncbi:MAG TPA: DUF3137 domain-containing protein [Mycobacteriales bacterium]|nr:DUF3137 domain-containing protein [Mycobacteriales bacterium]
MDPFWLFGAAGFLLVGVVGYIGYQQEKKRRAQLMAFARSQGWTYSASDDSWADRFEGAPFGTGDDRTVTNILSGPWQGEQILAFDYSYETSTTDSKGNRRTTTHRFAVCALSLPGWLPTLELRPENVLTRLGGALGLDDVELESEDFNRRYRVRASNPKFAYDVLHPRTMEALLTGPARNLRLAGTAALCWEDGRLLPVELLARLRALQVLVSGIPSFVWTDHATQGAPE